MIELFKKISITENQKKKFLEGFVRQVVFCFQKKVNLILFERTPSKKKQPEKGTKQKKR